MEMRVAVIEMQSALSPAGDQAAHISGLWWFYFWVLIVIFALTVLALLVALYRRRSPIEVPLQDPVAEPPIATERRMSITVISLVAANVAILFCLLFVDMFVGRDVYAVEAGANPLVIKVTGHQWWWEVQYTDAAPSKVMTTAKEVHVPTGKPVKLGLDSTDVIHSFWVPAMHGKKDLIPGHPTTHWFKAEKEGTFRGQCAEFCGHQHAHMRLEFVVQSPDKFEEWLGAARQNSRPPSNPSEQHGQEVFVSNQCVMCHTIQGTNARATVGPDLTHFASRELLAGGAVPNTRGYLAGWIANPQNIKPGVRMPPNNLGSNDLNALVDYLDSLK